MEGPLSDEVVAAAYRDACLAELDALKPGNVHRWSGGHRMDVADFEASAEASAPLIAAKGLGVGARILQAVEATFATVGMNTNLGILLLCAPLAAAAESVAPTTGENAQAALRQRLRAVLAELSATDAADVFRAIARAAPGGLGTEPSHDVRAMPTIGLCEAMRIAAPRDRIAAQYAGAFADIFDVGLTAFISSKGCGETGMWPTLRCFMAFATRFPDSHVARKFGEPAALTLLARMRRIDNALNSSDVLREREAILASFDKDLKGEGINPGTTADLTVASLFTARLVQKLQ